jgi:uncharacterized protein
MIRDPTLHLSKDLRLPVEAVTQTVAILAKRGAGKTYTAAVMVEEMLKAGLQLVVVDPVGVWWGLRSSADGQHEGLPIVIMGGEQGDLPPEVGPASSSLTWSWKRGSPWCWTCHRSAKVSRRGS